MQYAEGAYDPDQAVAIRSGNNCATSVLGTIRNLREGPENISSANPDSAPVVALRRKNEFTNLLLQQSGDEDDVDAVGIHFLVGSRNSHGVQLRDDGPRHCVGIFNPERDANHVPDDTNKIIFVRDRT